MEITISEFLKKFGKCSLRKYNENWTLQNDKVIAFMDLSRADYLEAKEDDEVLDFEPLPKLPAKKGKKPRDAYRMSYMA